MKLTRYWMPAAVMLAAAIAAVGYPDATASETAGPQASADTRPVDQTATSAERDRATMALAFQDAQAGRFDKSITLLRPLATSKYCGNEARKAVQLMLEHITRQKHAKAQRNLEQAQAIDRVSQAMLAQQARAALETSGKLKTYRKAADAVVETYRDVPLITGLLELSDAEAGKRQTEALEVLNRLSKTAQEYLDVIKDDKTPFGQATKQLLTTLKMRVAENSNAWKRADMAKTDDRIAAMIVLTEQSTDLALAAADVETMTLDKPWQIATAQGRLAKELAGSDKTFANKPWYTSLVADTEARAIKAVADAEWYDSLSAYMALEDLVKGVDAARETTFVEKVKVSRRHVRVLRLYGKEDGSKKDSATTQPTTAAVTDTGITWKEMVVGIDAAMVREVIDRLNDYYVTPVVYRKVARGAMRSLKVLAETPQAARSFPLLKDDKKRKAFVASIDHQLTLIDKTDRVDHIFLIASLNSLLRSSENTVKIPVRVLAMEFTDGFLDELDRFSAMIWPFDVDDFTKTTMGKFYGVGIQITKEQGEPLKVVTPLEDTPGYRAGIKAGDLILKVDGRVTNDLSVDKLVRMITGPEGTEVVLTISRQGKQSDVAVKRAAIKIKTVRGWRRKPGGGWDFWIDSEARIGYMRLTQFTGETPSEVQNVLDIMQKQGARGLILDLRFNPGGLLRSATSVADEFITAGPLVSTKGRQIPRSVVNARRSGTSFPGGRLAVLINEHSASASEILSGALLDHKRALVVGRRTYGKGSVQNVIPIRSQRAFLKLTTAYYYLPSGRLLHRQNGAEDWGVNPNVEIYMTPRQMRRWQDLVRKNDVLRQIDQKRLSASLERQYNADLQLGTAVLLMKLRALKDTPVIPKPAEAATAR